MPLYSKQSLQSVAAYQRLGVLIALFLLVISLPPLLINAYQIQQRSHAVVSTSLAQLLDTGQDIAYTINHFIDSGRDVLLSLTEVAAVNGGDDRACSEFMSRMARNLPQYTNFSKVNAEKFIICSSGALPTPVDVSNSPNIIAAFNTGQFAVSPFKFGPLTGEPVLVLSQPLFDALGQVSGTVNNGLSLYWLQDYFHTLTIPEGTQITLLDQYGRIIAAHPAGRLNAGMPLPANTPLVQAALQVEEPQRYADEHGQAWLIARYRVDRIPDGVQVVVQLAEHTVLAPLACERNRQFIGLLGLFLLSLLTALWAAQYLLLTPVGRLVRLAGRLSAGDMTARYDGKRPRGELGVLVKAYDYLATSLQARERERQRLITELARRNRLYNLLSHCNRATVYCQSEQQLLQQVCEDAVTHGGFKMAWIGFIDAPRQLIKPVVAKGEGTAFLDGIRISLDPHDPFGQGPSSLAITEDRPYWCQDYATDPATAPWRQRPQTCEWGAAAALPLHRNGKVIGVLALYAEESVDFDADARALLMELAANLDFAFKHFDDQATLRRAATVFAHTREGVLITNAEHKVVAANTAFTEITGYTEAEIIGQDPRILKSGLHPVDFYRRIWTAIRETGYWQGEIWNRRKSGETYPQWQTVSEVRDTHGSVTHYVSVFSDLSGIRNAEQQLEYLAHHDPLTGLPNRLLLALRVEHALERQRNKNRSMALLFIDLDHFKHINESLGHKVGDSLLLQAAERITQLLSNDDTLARIGGDEFVLLMERLKRSRHAADMAARIIQAFAEPFVIDEHTLHIGASMGISLSPEDGEDFPTLLRNADAAMHQAKDHGRNNYQFYTTALTTAALQRVSLENSLRQALKQEQFEVFYQPQIDLIMGQVTGAEALVRWSHPEKGRIAPDQFIPLAEETGLIVLLGEWVLNTACQQLYEWQKKGLPIARISVNIAGEQLHRGDLVATVRQVLKRTKLPASALDLEITEGFIMQKAEHSIETLDQLRALGISLSIDDFGTGYSSLAYLKRLPIHTLKIDKSFIRDIPTDADNTAITRAVIALAESLQLEVVAEGIETTEQRQFLLHHGCHLGQGYLYSPPLDAAAFYEYVQKQSAESLSDT